MIFRRKPAALRIAPEFVQRHILHFEACIETETRAFARSFPDGARVLDAGAGESQYAPLFERHRYTAVDLGVGDAAWTYRALDAITDLQALPFMDATFDAVVNIVTLEHVREPVKVIRELARVLRPNGRMLLVTPLEWEEHQQPHDYFRYTRYGIAHLLASAGLEAERIEPAGGFFRLLARRLLYAPQFFPAPLSWIVLAAAAPVGLALPLLDRFDRDKHFTLGHICVAHKPLS